jgi:hypothetical protein
MRAVASAGFEGAARIRGEALEGYGAATGAATARIVAYNQARTQEGMANADRSAQASTQQAMLNLEHMGLATHAHQAYADAKAQAQQLQAKLDSDFQAQRIDAARYMQMSQSVQASFAASMAQLAEQAREFDITQQSQERGAQRQLTASGRDVTGRPYGPMHSAGGTFGPMAG